MFSNQALYTAFLVAVSLFLSSCSGGGGGGSSDGGSSGGSSADAQLIVSAITGDTSLNLGESESYTVTISDADGIDLVTTELLDNADVFVQALPNTVDAGVYTLTLDSAGLIPGIYRIEVTAVGVDGGTGANSAATTVSFEVEVLAVDALLSVSSISGSAALTVGDSANYSLTIADADGVDTVTTQLKDDSDSVVRALPNSNASDLYTVVFDSAGLTPGIYTIEATARGVDGGVGDNSGPITVTINVQVNAVPNDAPTASNLSVTDSNAGAVVVGDTLDGDYDYGDTEGDTEGVSTYRWLRDGTPIAGATNDSYSVIPLDVGTSISFEVTPVAVTGTATGVAVVSSAVNVVNSAPVATNASISDVNGGATVVGDVLNGSYTYSDVDGDTEGVSTFRWLRDGVAIGGATNASYTLVSADSGAEISFEVTPVAASGVAAGVAVASSSVSVVNSVPVADNAQITDVNGGTTFVGDDLQGSYDYSDLDADIEGTSTFRWLRDGVAIGGATNDTYTLVAADTGANISFEITPVAATGDLTGVAITSSAVSVTNSVPVADNVSISDINGGIAVAGDDLQGNYDYSDLDGDAEGTSTFRWLRDSVAIAGATTDSYTLVSADAGTDIVFEVTPIASAGDTTGSAVASSALSVTNTIPTASVIFPSTSVDTFTNQTSITVRGTASDADGTVASVVVDGVSATTSNGFATWSASVSLVSGDNDLTVSITDNLGGSNASVASLTVRHEPTVLFNPIAIAEDVVNNIIYLLDTTDDPIVYSFDTTTDTYTVISGGAAGSGTALTSPISMVFDSTNDVLIVSDEYVNGSSDDVSALIEIDVATGVRTLIGHNDADITAVGSGDTITNAFGLSVDDANELLLVADFQGNQIVSVDIDPLSGTYLTRTQLATGLGFPQYIDLDTTVADLAYIYSPFDDRFSSVDLSTGTPTTLSETGTGTGDMPEFVADMTFDSGDGQLLVVDSSTNTIHAIDTTTGNRTEISDDATGTGIAATGEMFLEVDTVNDVLLIATQDQNGVIEFDLTSSVRTLITPNTQTATGQELTHPAEVVFYSTDDEYLVLDANANALLSVDSATGERTELADISTNLEDFNTSGMALDDIGDRVFIFTNNPTFSFAGDGDDILLSVDLGTGVNTVISQNGGTGSGDNFSEPSSIAWDAPNDRVLVTETSADWLLEVDITTGARDIVSNTGTGTGPDMTSPVAIAIDTTTELAYVADDSDNAIYTVDISTGLTAGNRLLFSASGTGIGTDFTSPKAVWLDDANDRLLVADQGSASNRFFAVDLTTGDRTVLATISAGEVGNCPYSFEYDETIDVMVGADSCSDSIVMTDLVSGETVVFSK